MAVTSDIGESWRRPRVVFRRKLGEGLHEGRLLAILLGACGLIYVAQWPRLARASQLDPSVPLDARMAITLFALLFVAPLLFYALATISHWLAQTLGGKATAAAARLALFWALLVVSPLMLLQGLLSGFLGATPAVTGVGVGVLLAFLVLWGNMLYEAER
ncbi:MAG: YIP1 family protein [Paracoccaceae bacterium]|nr:YIP1 family protein [Paracoccaceae bacterium]